MLDASTSSSREPADTAAELRGEPRRPRGITAARSESQHRVSVEQAAALERAVASYLPCRFGADGGSPVATVYFDTPWGSFLQRCEESVLSDRLRLREYAPSAESPDRQYWIERKRRLGSLSEKLRRRLPIEEVTPVLQSVWSAAAAFGSISADLGEAPLAPVLVVQYRRVCFADDVCRITFDRGVSFYSAASRCTLPLGMSGALPLHAEPGATLEVKVSGIAPDWVDDLVDGLDRHAHSKFVRGCRALAAGASRG